MAENAKLRIIAYDVQVVRDSWLVSERVTWIHALGSVKGSKGKLRCGGMQCIRYGICALTSLSVLLCSACLTSTSCFTVLAGCELQFFVGIALRYGCTRATVTERLPHVIQEDFSCDSITGYLEAVRNGVPGANDVLFAKVYETLRRIAANRLGMESRNWTVHPTELVHEAWLRMGGDGSIAWENRRHLFGAAAEAMRRFMVDNARRRKRVKRGGPEARQQLLCDSDIVSSPVDDDILDLNDALAAFELVEPIKAQVVKLKFFGGMTIKEIAEVMDLSAASVERYWAYAKAWIHQRLKACDAK